MFGNDPDLVEFIDDLRTRRIAGYRNCPADLGEHANIESRVVEGGYQRRQIYELIQNAADAIAEDPGVNPAGNDSTHCICVELTPTHLYVANTGAPLSKQGVDTLVRSHTSWKSNHIGRFGLGFKSVLAVTNNPQIFSETVCLEFDRYKSQRELNSEVPESDDKLPAMRLAWPIPSPKREVDDDDILRDLASWATTVVRLPLKTEREETEYLLSEEIEDFPGEFILFTRSDLQLRFHNKIEGTRRKIRKSRVDEDTYQLETTEGATTWYVFQDTIEQEQMPERARQDQGELYDYDQLPMTWAVPANAKLESGLFWAFFPLQEESRVPGLINTFWKTNDDRQNLVDGPFNRALMKRAAALIADNIPSLHDPEDPGRTLDAFPRRDRGQEETAGFLAEHLWEKLADSDVIPNGEGELRSVAELDHFPVGEPEIVQEWHRAAGPALRRRFNHPATVENRDRTSRYKKLLGRFEGRQRCPPDEWVESIVDTKAYKSITAIRLVDQLIDHPTIFKGWKAGPFGAEDKQDLRDAEVVLNEAGEPQSRYRLYFPDDAERCKSEESVHHLIRTHDEVRAILENTFEIDQYDPVATEVEALLEIVERSEQETGEDEWNRFWNRLRQLEEKLGPQVAKKVSESTPLYVKTLSGTWRPFSEVLEYDALFESADKVPEADRNRFVDQQFHERDAHVLDAVGLSARLQFQPFLKAVASRNNTRISFQQLGPDTYKSDSVTGEYFQYLDRRYRQICRIKDASVNYESRCLTLNAEETKWVKNSGLLQTGTTETKSRLTQWLLRNASFDDVTLQMHHRSRGYPKRVAMLRPIPWALLKFGIYEIGNHQFGAAELRFAIEEEFVSSDEGLWARFDTLLDRLEYADAVSVGYNHPDLFEFSISSLPDLDETSDIWPLALEQARRGWGTTSQRTELYNEAATSGWIPDRVFVNGQSKTVDHIYVTDDDALVEQSPVPSLLVREEVLPLFLEAGATPLDVEVEVRGRSSGAEQLETALGEVGEHIAEKLDAEVSIHYCSEIVEKYPDRKSTSDFLFDAAGNELFVSDQAPALRSKDAQEEILRILEANGLFEKPKGAEDTQAWLDNLRWDVKLARLRQIDVPSERLAAAVDYDSASLLECLPEPAAEVAQNQELDAQTVAALLVDTYGKSVLKETRPALEQHGFADHVPKRWTSGPMTTQFVQLLDFDKSYAGSPSSTRDPSETALGSPKLGSLHTFQRDAYSDLANVLTADSRPDNRAILALPTGSGKTRVTVQAVVKEVLRAGQSPLIVWIAHRDELCEQAVQSFLEIWRAKGPPDDRLVVSRLWGRTNSDVTEKPNAAQVVVSTNQTLANRVDRQSFQWLRGADAIVIDEGHRGIAPTYTTILEAFSNSIPVVGLTATPFRNLDDDETRRLAMRYDERRIPAEDARHSTIPEMYRHLQKKEILSDVEQEQIRTGVEFQFTEEEEAKFEEHEFLKYQFPESASERLGRVEDRNELILERLTDIAPDSKVLFFANSVDHAHEIAARLNIHDIPSRSIVGETGQTLRQDSIRRFRAGEIRVLTNYQVLSVGFDAPKVETIMIARPMFSRNLYQQVIGRGLRGPKNGGTEECRIINLKDNFAKYGDQIAFDNLNYWWSN